jgi:hypothetical protein
MIGVTSTLFYSISFSPSSIANWVHAVLGALTERQTRQLEQDISANLTKLLHTTQTLATDKKHYLPKLLPSIFSIK